MRTFAGALFAPLLLGGLLFGLLLMGGSTVFAQDDVTPPQIVAVSLGPAHINTATGPQTITVTAHITDDLSGVASALVRFRHWDTGEILQATYLPPSGWRESGDELDGVYGVHIHLPQHAPQGWWMLRTLSADDLEGYRQTLSFDEAGKLDWCIADCPQNSAAWDGIGFYNGESPTDRPGNGGPLPNPTNEPAQVFIPLVVK